MLFSFNCSKCRAELECDISMAGTDAKCPQCGNVMPVPQQSLGPGTTIGGFEIIRMLGEGGMGEVYLARQLSLERNVALKILPSHMKIRRGIAERFFQEVKLLAKLEHTNIVMAYEAGEDAGTMFLAMGYADGKSLEQKLRDGPLDEGEALDMIKKLAGALEYAWNDHRLIHRDIKPSNVMLTRSGELKLMDFGLAKCFIEDTALTLSGTVMGTPNYMSPEQAEGGQDLDFRSDLYSLGATLYHMLTGTLPFAGSSVMETLRKQVNESLPDPRTLNPAISENCVTLLEFMLSKDRANRYQDYKALIGDITRVRAGKSPVRDVLKPGESVLLRANALNTGRRTPPKPEVQGASRKLQLVPVAAIAAVMLAAVAIWVISLSSEKQTVAAPHSAMETQADAVGEDGIVRPDAEERMSVAEGMFLEIEEFEREHAGRHEEALERARRARANALAGALAELRERARILSDAGEYDQAMSVYREYAGEFAAELLSEREHGIAAVTAARERAVAAARERAAAELTARAALVDGRIRGVIESAAAALARLDISGALSVLENARGETELKDSRDIAAAAAELQELPRRLRESFVADAGREVELDIRGRKVRLNILKAGEDGIEVRQQVGGGLIVRNVPYSDLSVRERYNRLSRDSEPDLIAGLLLLEGRREDMALEAFERAGTPLALAVRETLVSAARQREDAQMVMHETAAARGYERLIESVGIAADERDTARIIRAVRHKRFTETQVEHIRRQLQLLRNEYATTQILKDSQAVLDTLAMIIPGFPLDVDAEMLDRAMEKLQQDNPREVFRHRFEYKGNELSLTLHDYPSLGNISALKGLPIVHLSFNNCQMLSDLSPIMGMPLKSLEIRNCQNITHIDFLKGMSLKRLRIEGINLGHGIMPVSNINVLKGMPIEELNLRCTRVADLSALRGMPIRVLNIDGTAVTDLRPLIGMPLEDLNIGSTRITDLRPLEDLPLIRLDLRGSTVSDLRPVSGIQGLIISR